MVNVHKRSGKMDLFIDKLAQKISSTDNTRGNQSANAKEIAKLKEKVENYEKLLQEMKMLNLKNIESAGKLSELVDDAAKAFNECKEDSGSEEMRLSAEEAEADREMIRELFGKQEDTIHRENIKVYRNVQAAVSDSLAEKTKEIIDAQNNAARSSRTGFLKVMSVLIFLAVLADIALRVLPMFGIKLF